jgi:menaquinone-dependent protoporphyrinogen oxidase
MSILIAVASKHGSTREIAEAIAGELRAEHLAVELYDVREVSDVSGYDAVILGSAVYAGSWLPEAREFAEHHRATLANLPVWVFSSGPIGPSAEQPREDPKRLAGALGDVAVREHRVFVGKLDKHNLGLLERVIAQVVRAPDGDFREWDGIRAWAREIAHTLQAPAAPV